MKTVKFWMDNEKKVIKKFGLNPTPGSGSGNLIKEDGQNDKYIMQLKSTEKESITIKKLDILKLIYNADQTRKIPLFAIQFYPDIMIVGILPEYLKELLDEDQVKKSNIKIEERRKEKSKLIEGIKKQTRNEEKEGLEKSFEERAKRKIRMEERNKFYARFKTKRES